MQFADPDRLDVAAFSKQAGKLAFGDLEIRQFGGTLRKSRRTRIESPQRNRCAKTFREISRREHGRDNVLDFQLHAAALSMIASEKILV